MIIKKTASKALWKADVVYKPWFNPQTNSWTFMNIKNRFSLREDIDSGLTDLTMAKTYLKLLTGYDSE